MRNNKIKYYLGNALAYLVPSFLFRLTTKRRLESPLASSQHVLERVNYYNKLNADYSLSNPTAISDYKKTGGWTYFFDLYSTLKYFPKHNQVEFINGDVTHVPSVPSFVKSRPISVDTENQNSVLLKLNKVRHFNFISDPIPYSAKKDMVVWRGAGSKAHRAVVIKQFYNHPQCNIGQTKPIIDAPWVKDKMTILEQLQYKFILAIEGNDVATNLKWAMSSNSVVIMAKPKFETWFMEGRLEAGIHYIEVRDDYSNLIEQVNYYLDHEDDVLKIIRNAHQWLEQFGNKETEKTIELLVADKYFRHNRLT